MKVIKPGSSIKCKGVTGDVTILQACIELGDLVTYQILYYNKGDRKTEWVKDFELSPYPSTDYIPIGFK